MRSTITISLPNGVRAEIDRICREEGVSRSDIVRQSLRDYLFLRQFRSLRRSMAAKAARRGIRAGQDLFDRVS